MDNTEITFDPSSLSAKDLADIEDYSGRSVAEFAEPGTVPPMRVLIGIVFVVTRKQNHDVTIADIEQMTVDQLAASVGNADARPES